MKDIEYEQAIVRVLMGTFIIAIVFVSAPTSQWMNYVFSGFFVAALALLGHIRLYKGDFPIRKLTGQLVDMVSVSLVLFFGGENAAVGYCVYLWVIVGNGCRFGIFYLISSTILAALTFGFISLKVPFWQQHTYLALGLWLTLIIVPLYLTGLLKRLTSTQKRLDDLSRQDELTGLMNRRAFNEQIDQEFHRLSREDSPFGLIMIDIDHFKSFNDKYGHIVGDKVLKQVAKCLINVCREVDFVARFGGEEFALLAPNLCKKGSQSLGERLRETIESEPITVDNKPLKVTISVGIACWAPNLGSVNNWIKAADTALYQAKNQGRNRVVFLSNV